MVEDELEKLIHQYETLHQKKVKCENPKCNEEITADKAWRVRTEDKKEIILCNECFRELGEVEHAETYGYRYLVKIHNLGGYQE